MRYIMSISGALHHIPFYLGALIATGQHKTQSLGHNS